MKKFDNTEHVKESVAGVIISGNSILLGKRADLGGSMDNRWEIPGGKCEAGENHCEALQREFEEEFSAMVGCGEELDSQGFSNHGSEYRVYAYRVQNDEPIVCGEHHSELKWFDRFALESLIENEPSSIVDSDRNLLLKLLQADTSFPG